MIHYVSKRSHRFPIANYLDTRGAPLARRIHVFPYETLLRRRRLRRGVYIFTDVDRLSRAEAEEAARVWAALNDFGGSVLLNHPTRSLRRFELLRMLYERGANAFNVYRVTERRRPERFPVFLRAENDHHGPQTPLLCSPAELGAALEELERSGTSREDKLIVEFCDTAGRDGRYRKYSALRVGDRILPRHVFFSSEWVVKGWKLLDEALMEEERRYVETNPHEDAIRSVFQTARIEYGRVDYALRDGAIQVFEINTNPMLVGERGGGPPREAVNARFAATLRETFETLDVATVGRRGTLRLPGSGSRLRKVLSRLRRPLGRLYRAVGRR